MNRIHFFSRFSIQLCILIALSLQVAAEEKILILALGDSLTEGYGVDKHQAYPFLLERSLKKKGYNHVKVINAGISGSTSASAKSRLKWYLKVKPSILILSLGGNDGLRGLDINYMKRNLGETIVMAKSQNIRVLLAGMQMPLNYGPEYTKSFKNAFFELADKYQVALIPFLLKDVGAIPQYNLEDGIHPNPEGHKIISKTVLNHVLTMLED